MKNKILLFLGIIAFALLTIKSGAYASGPTDEIINYDITVDVNSDGTLNMNYHIDWKVLQSGGDLGPVSWVEVGLPNKHYSDVTVLNSTISYISEKSSSLEIHLDREYYEGEIIPMDFCVTMDYMYQIEKYNAGETVYSFTPGWFDGIEVDSLVIKWNEDQVIQWQPDAYIDGGYITWETALGAGGKFTVEVTYSNTAFGFDTTKSVDGSSGSSDDDLSFGEGILGFILMLLGILIIGLLFLSPFIIVGLIIYAVGRGAKGSSATSSTKKITRTLIKYHPTCPGCGAARPEGKDKCDYCGRSFIASEEVVEEKDIPNAKNYSTAGTYRYTDSGDSNTFIRVNVVNIPVVTRSSSSGSSSRSSCVHSSCAHSSCACASHCACACACAGGGRAGCSTKDFYSTSLKLSQLKKKRKKNKE